MNSTQTIPDPPFARWLWGSTSLSWLWLAVRVYVGWQWLTAGWEKFNNPQWITTGLALKGFWERAVATPATGSPPIAFGWYRDFLEALLNGGHYVWFAKLVVIGEQAVGIALILGAFVGIAAFAGAFMNWNFMMAGSASVNPMLFLLSIILVLAWKTAGYYGFDRWLLPLVGVPWQPGALVGRHARREAPTAPAPQH